MDNDRREDCRPPQTREGIPGQGQGIGKGRGGGGETWEGQHNTNDSKEKIRTRPVPNEDAALAVPLRCTAMSATTHYRMPCSSSPPGLHSPLPPTMWHYPT